MQARDLRVIGPRHAVLFRTISLILQVMLRAALFAALLATKIGRAHV